jgi:hypothetical protein
MKQLVDKLVLLERDISTDKGEFVLFALFLREDALDRWDLVVSAPWIEANKKEALDYLVSQLQPRLEPEELLFISRIVLIDKDNPALEAIHKSIKAEHSAVEVVNSNFFGLQIERAYIITSNRESAVANPVILTSS